MKKHSLIRRSFSVGRLILSCAFMFAATIACAQSYYYNIVTGLPAGYNYGQSGTTLLSSNPVSQNDVLSTKRTLPFPWTFFGQSVTKYLVSDNGYITFDTTAVTSFPNNTSVPNAANPNKAIYAFWDDAELTSYSGVHDYIYSWTYGSFPNRVHVIQWSGITPKGTSPQTNYTYFAILIHEGGNFDIVHNFGRGPQSGTVGVEDATGTDATMVTGSPSFVLPITPILTSQMKVYKFYYGTQPTYDIVGDSVSTPWFVSSGTNVSMTGDLINYGKTTITSMDLNYRIDGGAVQTQTLTGLNFVSNTYYNFTHNIQWSAVGPGVMHNIKVWCTKLNGSNNDNVPANDSIFGTIFVNNGVTATREVLIEEFSTAPCGYCPEGNLMLQNIIDSVPKTMAVTHHSGYLTDSMTIPEDLAYESVFAFGAPTATIDRTWFPGETMYALGRGVWKSYTLQELGKKTPVDLGLSTTYNSSNRQLNINVDANFVDYAYPGDIRISVFIVEDSVMKIGAGYDQTNYYNTTFGHAFYNKGNPIVGFYHMHVLRAVPSGTWGSAGVIPSNPGPSQTYSKNYLYTLPTKFKEKRVKVIAFVNYYNQYYKEVLNAKEVNNIFTGIEAPEKALTSMELYPNPSNGEFGASFSLESRGELSLEILNTLGEKVYTENLGTYLPGTHTVYYDKGGLAPGIYMVSLRSGEQRMLKKLVVSGN